MTVIGSAYVNIRAITDKLESDVRKAVEAINESITVKVDVDVSAATAKIAALSSSVQDQVMSVHADTSDAMADIANISHLTDQTVTVLADTLPAREEFSDMQDDMNSQTVSPVVTLDDIAARAKLAFLTRTRDVRINVKANEATIKAVGGFFARLSGARVIVDDIGRLAHHFANIDKLVPGISKLSVLIGSIGGAAISSVGGLTTLGGSLVGILNMAAIAGPGMAAGFVVGIGTLMVALKDFSKQLPFVVSQYKTLSTAIRANFWDVAREPIREMTQTLFPEFQSGLANTGAALGRWSSAVSKSIQESLTQNGRLGKMFGYLNSSIDKATAGSAATADSLAILGEAGGAVLPRLAGWFTEVSKRFNTFLKESAANGDLNFWINNGIDNLKRLGEVIFQTAGIFNKIEAAATMAGSDGLGTILNFVTRINDALGSPEGVRAMVDIFSGANAVTSALGDSFFQIFGALGTAAPSIRSAFESISGVIGSLSSAISSIISDPAFQAGFEDMFNGIEAGFGKLAPVIGTMGPKMGAFLSIIGSLAENIGGILAAAFEVALPTITALKQALDPLIPVLGDALIQIIHALQPAFDALTEAIVSMAPAITDIVKASAPFIADFVEKLAPALPALAAGLLAGVAAFKAFSGIQSILYGLMNLAGIFGKAELAVKLFNIALRLNPIGLIITGIVALGAALVVAYNNVGWFKDFVDGAFKAIQDVIAGIIAWWNSDFIPMWEGAGKAAGEFFGGIGKWVGEAAANIGKFFGDLGKGIGDFFGGIGGMVGDGANAFGDFFGGIGKGISDAFNGAAEFVSTAIGNIGAGISAAVQPIIDGWNAAWKGIQDGFKAVWEGLVYIFGPVVELIGVLIGGLIEIVVTIWQVGWEIVSTIFIGVWQKIVEFFTPVITAIVDTVTNAVSAIQTGWQVAWQFVSDVFTNIWNGIVAFVTPIITTISSVITSVVNGIVSAWNTAWSAISSFFSAVWSGIVAFVTPIIDGIRNTIVSVITGISNTWNAIWTAISTVVRNVWSGIVSFVVAYVTMIQSRIQAVISVVQAIWNAGWAMVRNAVTNAWNAISSAVGQIVSTVQTKIGQVVSFFSSLPGKIVSGLGNLASLLVSSGRDVVQGLINGARGMIDNAVQAIKDVGGAMLGGIRSFLGIKSPSREFMKIGHWVTMGMVEGIKGGQKAAVKTVANLAQRITDAATVHFTRAGMASVQKAGKAGWEIQQGRFLDRVAAQVRAQVSTMGRLAAQREALATRLKASDSNVSKILGVRNKEADKVAGNLRGEFKLSNMVGMDAKSMVEGANAIAARIRAFGSKITALRSLGLSATLISEVAALGSEDGSIVADELIRGGRSGVQGLNAAYKNIEDSTKGTGLAVANGMYGAGLAAAQGIANGIRRNIQAVDSAAKAIGDRLISQVKKTLGIRSPSRVMRDQVGMQIGAGLAQGIRNSIKLVSSAADDLMDAATPNTSAINFGLGVSSAPVIGTANVLGTATTRPVDANTLTTAAAASGGVNVIVNPSAAMDEVAIGRAAARELNWQLISG